MGKPQFTTEPGRKEILEVNVENLLDDFFHGKLHEISVNDLNAYAERYYQAIEPLPEDFDCADALAFASQFGPVSFSVFDKGEIGKDDLPPEVSEHYDDLKWMCRIGAESNPVSIVRGGPSDAILHAVAHMLKTLTDADNNRPRIGLN